jgi:2,3-diaminopropionate biosynthesis protein SbnB
MSAIKEIIGARRLAYIGSQAVARSGIENFGMLIDAVERAYLAHARQQAVLPKSDYLRYPQRSGYDRIITLLGYLGDDFEVSGVKQICSSTANAERGFPRASGLIVMNDPETNRPFAIVEASLISAARTAAVTGLALRELATPAMKRIALIGCGQLARTHLKTIAGYFGTHRFEFLLFDVKPEAMQSAMDLARSLGLMVDLATSQRAAIEAADITITATTAEKAYVEYGWLKPDGLYCAVSLLDANLDVFTQARHIVVDDLLHCLHEGRPLERLLRQGNLPRERIVEFGNMLNSGERLKDDGGLRVFNPMGTIITDLAVAKTIFEEAMAKNDVVFLDV